MTPQRLNVPQHMLSELRSVCLELPEASEDIAWAGIRWSVRKKNFAHVLTIENGWPPAYAKAASTDGPACVLTFRSRGRKLEPPSFDKPPFFRPVWFPNIVGMFIDDSTDWERVARLVTESYRVLAPQKLIDRME